MQLCFLSFKADVGSLTQNDAIWRMVYIGLPGSQKLVRVFFVYLNLKIFLKH